jgi:RNA polymerase sigma factor (sigma-70 family)
VEGEITFQSKTIGTRKETGFSAEVLSLTDRQAGAAIDAPADSAPLRDQRLVRAAQWGCRNAFDELISLYSKRVRRTILGITKNPEDAEDAMQDTFLRAFMAIGRFEGRATFYSWLTRIAINSAFMVLRRQRSRREVSLHSSLDWNGEIVPMDVMDSAAGPEQVCCEQQRHALLTAVMGFASAGVWEWLRDRRTTKREREARRDAQLERRNVFQRETLLELQDVLMKMTHTTFSILVRHVATLAPEDETDILVPPPDLDLKHRDAMVRISILCVRLHDETLVSLVNDFTNNLFGATSGNDLTQRERKILSAVQTRELIDERIRVLLREMDNSEILS